MTDESRKLFEKMVKRGQAIEKETKDLINEANKRISSQALDLETISTQLNQGLNDIRKTFSDRLGLPEPVTRADLDRLEAKIDALAARIEKLEQGGTQGKPQKSAATAKSASPRSRSKPQRAAAKPKGTKSGTSRSAASKP